MVSVGFSGGWEGVGDDLGMDNWEGGCVRSGYLLWWKRGLERGELSEKHLQRYIAFGSMIEQ